AHQRQRGERIDTGADLQPFAVARAQRALQRLQHAGLVVDDQQSHHDFPLGLICTSSLLPSRSSNSRILRISELVRRCPAVSIRMPRADTRSRASTMSLSSAALGSTMVACAAPAAAVATAVSNDCKNTSSTSGSNCE